jgi:hypothetical protein
MVQNSCTIVPQPSVKLWVQAGSCLPFFIENAHLSKKPSTTIFHLCWSTLASHHSKISPPQPDTGAPWLTLFFFASGAAAADAALMYCMKQMEEGRPNKLGDLTSCLHMHPSQSGYLPPVLLPWDTRSTASRRR